MVYKLSHSKFTLTILVVLFFIPLSYSQTKKIKRPKSNVGISSVDNFVRESFDLYDKVYKYDGYAEAGTSLEDEDIDTLEEALDDITGLSESAPDILSDLDGQNVLKQGKATLQINKSKKALKYSIKTAKELLLGERKGKEEKSDNGNNTKSDKNTDSETSEDDDSNQNEEEKEENISDNLEIYSKFDYVPGDKLIFFEDFSQGFVGDFPARWNTNGSGEIVRINKVKGNWLQLKLGYNIYIIPDIKNLPEDYTIEFDVVAEGINKQTSSNARLSIILSDNDKFNRGTNHYADVGIPFGQYAAFEFRVVNYFNGDGGAINSGVKGDIRKEVLNQPHISISVTKKRLRLWVNQVKHVDIPRLIEELNVLNYMKFHISSFIDGKEFIFISNIKVAEGGVDLRRKLLSEGKISTNGILFDSGSKNIKPQSYGIIRQISQVLLQDENISLNIIGHTDADGDDDTNMRLSKSRAEAVKQALITVYKIDAGRLTSEGKGETEPLGDNATTEGKAQNRRVEFIKQ
ncbi:MAG: OmpA family protein [Psychroserpens sp.]|uniref:OmpA family protein n=1 Tax=Psychroserpens sp. TaxID=2020870 RepID=UPI0030015F31